MQMRLVTVNFLTREMSSEADDRFVNKVFMGFPMIGGGCDVSLWTGTHLCACTQAPYH